MYLTRIPKFAIITNDGQSWQSTLLNLPVVPITDLAIKEGNLNVQVVLPLKPESSA